MLHNATEVAGSRVRIDYRVELHYEVAGPSEFIFLIHPARTPQQEVLSESLALMPEVPHSLDIEPVTGNRLLKLKAEYERALPMYRQALALRREMLGNEHVDTARSVYELADLENSANDVRNMVEVLHS